MSIADTQAEEADWAPIVAVYSAQNDARLECWHTAPIIRFENCPRPCKLVNSGWAVGRHILVREKHHETMIVPECTISQYFIVGVWYQRMLVPLSSRRCSLMFLHGWKMLKILSKNQKLFLILTYFFYKLTPVKSSLSSVSSLASELWSPSMLGGMGDGVAAFNDATGIFKGFGITFGGLFGRLCSHLCFKHCAAVMRVLKLYFIYPSSIHPF